MMKKRRRNTYRFNLQFNGNIFYVGLLKLFNVQFIKNIQLFFIGRAITINWELSSRRPSNRLLIKNREDKQKYGAIDINCNVYAYERTIKKTNWIKAKEWKKRKTKLNLIPQRIPILFLLLSLRKHWRKKKNVEGNSENGLYVPIEWFRVRAQTVNKQKLN